MELNSLLQLAESVRGTRLESMLHLNNCICTAIYLEQGHVVVVSNVQIVTRMGHHSLHLQLLPQIGVGVPSGYPQLYHPARHVRVAESSRARYSRGRTRMIATFNLQPLTCPRNERLSGPIDRQSEPRRSRRSAQVRREGPPEMASHQVRTPRHPRFSSSPSSSRTPSFVVHKLRDQWHCGNCLTRR